MQVTGDRLQLTVGRGLAKCAAGKKLCVLFIWLAQFFRLSYSNFMAKGRFYGYKSTNYLNIFFFSCSFLFVSTCQRSPPPCVDVDGYPAGAPICQNTSFGNDGSTICHE